MLGAFANAFRTPDLRRKLLFVVAIIILFRLGSQLPAPGVNVANVQTCFDQATQSGGIYSLINLFSGGALLKLTVFALGILPYITASIILQLLTVVIPRLDALQKEGQSGTAKITQYTRYVTLALAVLQATGIVALARSGQLLQNCNKELLYNNNSIWTMLILVITMMAGTAVIMWMGELITDRGIGNGMSILIFTQVIASFPGSLWQVRLTNGWWVFSIVIIIGMALIAAVIFMEQGQRRVPVQYARRMVGRKVFGGSSTYIPLKVNQAGVIPVIFASDNTRDPFYAYGDLDMLEVMREATRISQLDHSTSDWPLAVTWTVSPSLNSPAKISPSGSMASRSSTLSQGRAKPATSASASALSLARP